MIDPVSLIVGALATGAAAGATEAAGMAIKDAYEALRGLIQRKFAGNSDAERALENYEQKPQVWVEPLKEALKETNAAEDDQIMVAAQNLVKLAEQAGLRTGVYVAVDGDRSIGIGGSVLGGIVSTGDKNKPS
ncbi:MAG TPA: hypothetical protein VF914_19975 [Chloroflexia bacterium]|jgi:hypothetical protein